MNIDTHRKQLLKLEQELVTRLGTEAAAGRETLDEPADAGDVADADELKDQSFTLAATDSTVLAETRAALRRIEDGTYGRCVVDGGPIEEPRLKSVPWTRYCLKHQAELEARAQTPTPSL